MPRLTRVDAGAITNLAPIIRGKSVATPNFFQMVVRGQAIQIHGPCAQGAVWGAVLADTELRGSYNFTANLISIFCGGRTFNTLSGVALEHIGRVLAHEVTHFIRNGHHSHAEKLAAIGFAEAYKKSRTPADYEAYISCSVELPAHASMIAYDLRHMTIAQQDFKAKMLAYSWSFNTYFAPHLVGAPNEQATINAIENEGFIAYQAII